MNRSQSHSIHVEMMIPAIVPVGFDFPVRLSVRNDGDETLRAIRVDLEGGTFEKLETIWDFPKPLVPGQTITTGLLMVRADNPGVFPLGLNLTARLTQQELVLWAELDPLVSAEYEEGGWMTERAAVDGLQHAFGLDYQHASLAELWAGDRWGNFEEIFLGTTKKTADKAGPKPPASPANSTDSINPTKPTKRHTEPPVPLAEEPTCRRKKSQPVIPLIAAALAVAAAIPLKNHLFPNDEPRRAQSIMTEQVLGEPILPSEEELPVPLEKLPEPVRVPKPVDELAQTAESALEAFRTAMASRDWEQARTQLAQLGKISERRPDLVGPTDQEKLQEALDEAFRLWCHDAALGIRRLVLQVARGDRAAAREELAKLSSAGMEDLDELRSLIGSKFTARPGASDAENFVRLYFALPDFAHLLVTHGVTGPSEERQSVSEVIKHLRHEKSDGKEEVLLVTLSRSLFDPETRIRDQIIATERLVVNPVDGGVVIAKREVIAQEVVRQLHPRRRGGGSILANVPDSDHDEIRQTVIDFLDAGDSGSTLDQADFFSTSVQALDDEDGLDQHEVRAALDRRDEGRVFRDYELVDFLLKGEKDGGFLFEFGERLRYSSDGENFKVEDRRRAGHMIREDSLWRIRSLTAVPEKEPVSQASNG